MGTPLLDCLGRGLRNLAANWQLLPLYLVQAVLVGLLTVAGFVPPVLAVGAGTVAALLRARTPTDALERLPEVGDALAALWLPLLVGLALASVVWTVAFLLFCYFQGGIYGTLMAGERGAPRGRSPRAAFAAFDAGRFHRLGRRLLWRYFWLLNLFLLLLLGVLAVVAVALLPLAGAGADARWDLVAAAGCLLAALVVAAAILIGIWAGVAQAELARETAGAWGSARRSLGVMVRRPGAVLGIFALFWIATLTVSLGGLPLWLLLGGYPGYQYGYGALGAELAIWILQWLLGAALSLGLASALVTLVRGEGEAGVEPEAAA